MSDKPAPFSAPPSERMSAGGPKLGAFGGVFAPSILTILGIIFYLRTGYIVGQVGLLDTAIIIVLAYVISTLTSLSLAAVATSMRVKGGGFYYVISRTLGFEFGGALGLVLFLSISIGIAFYAIGLGEVLVDLAFLPPWVSARGIAIGVIVFLFGFAWAGADVATKLQYVVMAVVFASIVAICWTAIPGWDAELAAANRGTPFSSEGGTLGFWGSFALFFPAITGFTQGLNMSGDLRDPERDIPLGTLAAVGLSFVLYIGLAILLAGNAAGIELLNDYLVLERIAPFAWIVTAGVVAATASSAMASFLGAPRIAQALGRDDVFPKSRYFAKGSGRSQNPRRAVLLSGAIALGAVATGNLNFLAPIITMFFLASYGLLNYATFFVAHAASPSFRPTFRAYHKYLSLAGCLACAGAMLAIDVVASIIAVLAIIAVHQYLQSRADKADWADSKRAFGFRQIREHLFDVERRPAHPREWRPQLLVLSKDEERRREAAYFASWIEGFSGLTSIVSIIEESAGDERDRRRVEKDLQAWVDRSSVEAFPLVVSASDFRTGLAILLQAYGVGPLKANTVITNWVEQDGSERMAPFERIYGQNLSGALDLGFNVVVLGAKPDAVAGVGEVPPAERRIDIWWGGGSTGDLMLLLGHLMIRSAMWQKAKLRIVAEAAERRPERTRERLDRMLDEVHIAADVEMVDHIDIDMVLERSRDASVTFVPADIEDGELKAAFGLEIAPIVDGLRLVAFCVAGEDIDLSPDPDDLADKEKRKLERKADAAEGDGAPGSRKGPAGG